MPGIILAGYAIGLAYFTMGDSVAAQDPRRFWAALLLWWIVAPLGAVNSLLNRL